MGTGGGVAAPPAKEPLLAQTVVQEMLLNVTEKKVDKLDANATSQQAQIAELRRHIDTIKTATEAAVEEQKGRTVTLQREMEGFRKEQQEERAKQQVTNTDLHKGQADIFGLLQKLAEASGVSVSAGGSEEGKEPKRAKTDGPTAEGSYGPSPGGTAGAHSSHPYAGVTPPKA